MAQLHKESLISVYVWGSTLRQPLLTHCSLSLPWNHGWCHIRNPSAHFTLWVSVILSRWVMLSTIKVMDEESFHGVSSSSNQSSELPKLQGSEFILGMSTGIQNTVSVLRVEDHHCIDGFSGKTHQCSNFSLPFALLLHCFMNIFHLYHCICHNNCSKYQPICSCYW